MFLDIAFGIFLALWTGAGSGAEGDAFLIVACIGLTLLPDIDALIELARHGSVGGKVVREHRELTHFPLLYAAATPLIWLIFGTAWTALFFAATMFHFVHDSVGVGYGVKWLWPFSPLAHKWFADKTGWWTLSQFHVSWTREELVAVAAKHGDTNWIRYCLPITWLGAAEFVPFVGAILLLLASR